MAARLLNTVQLGCTECKFSLYPNSHPNLQPFSPVLISIGKNLVYNSRFSCNPIQIVCNLLELIHSNRFSVTEIL